VKKTRRKTLARDVIDKK